MSDANPLMVKGRVWLFEEDNLNTDLMMPQVVFGKPIDEQVRHVFATYRPGWVDTVQAGDIMVCGRNFGTGSSRPASTLLKRMGIGAVVAETVNELFYRNSINCALPAMECAGICEFVREGDVVEVDVTNGSVNNVTQGKRLEGSKKPAFLQAIVRSGGIMERLRAEGYL
jgi:3-isopropylmalate/(R)-2-methylmalate dehydratase small subunit